MNIYQFPPYFFSMDLKTVWTNIRFILHVPRSIFIILFDQTLTYHTLINSYFFAPRIENPSSILHIINFWSVVYFPSTTPLPPSVNWRVIKYGFRNWIVLSDVRERKHTEITPWYSRSGKWNYHFCCSFSRFSIETVKITIWILSCIKTCIREQIQLLWEMIYAKKQIKCRFFCIFAQLCLMYTFHTL